MTTNQTSLATCQKCNTPLPIARSVDDKICEWKECEECCESEHKHNDYYCEHCEEKKKCLCATPNWKDCKCDFAKQSWMGEMQSKIDSLKKDGKRMYKALERIGTMQCKCIEGGCTCADDMMEIVEDCFAKLFPHKN